MNQKIDFYVKDVVVPEDVRYISDWEGYRLEDYNFPHILNKVLTGCGYTEFCLRNLQNIILLSPRKFLLENKRDQHKGDINIFYAENVIERLVNYELDISKETKLKSTEKILTDIENEARQRALQGFKDMIRGHWENCRDAYHLPCKILVTYDSFRHVIEALGEDIKNFQIVVDEFQSIFIDARFKSDAELELVNHLQTIQSKYKVQRICFVSATPMLEDYLVRLDEFRDLPYFRFDWETADPGRIMKPRIDIRYTSRPLSESINNVIEKYKSGKFEMRAIDDKIIESKEAVLFFNSVKGISQAIRTNKLIPEECNILCAKTPENERRIRDAFNDVIKEVYDNPEKHKIKKTEKVIGEIPLEGDFHKMFTFCTRTVYLGADFYSTNARSFIFSDSNVNCLSVDISLDLEQILGRQRLEINPWKNMATLYVKTTTPGKKTPKEEFQRVLDEKTEKSYSLLRAYENTTNEKDRHNLAEKFLVGVNAEHYLKDYVAVNRHNGSDLKPVFNNLMLLSEMRAFEVQQEDYADRFTVLSSIEGRGIETSGFSINQDLNQFLEAFNNFKQTTDKLRILSEFVCKDQGVAVIDTLFSIIPPKYKDYITILGPDRLKALCYRELDIKREILRLNNNGKVESLVKDNIYNTFTVGSRWSKSEIKETLRRIYDSLNYKISPKASQLEEYFNIKEVKIKEENKWTNGFEILSKK